MVTGHSTWIPADIDRQVQQPAPTPRLMMYAHDTYGLGHLRRSLAIARHMSRAIPNLSTLLVTGSPVAHAFELPPRTDYVKLPSVVKTDDEQYRAREIDLSPESISGLRASLLESVALHYAPDVMLVDHSPTGMKGEALPALRAIRRSFPGTKLVLGLRDVLDDPARVQRQWREQGVYDTIEELYDQVLIYGQPDIFNPVEAYAFPATLAARAQFTGYIQREEPVHLAPELRAELGLHDGPFVLVTAGGGGDGAVLEEASLEALELLGSRDGLQAVVVTGPLMDSPPRARLEERARALSPSVHLIPFHRDLPGLMRAASVVVSMGGYNTLCEIVSAGSPAIIVPRAHPRLEQHIRAEAFAARGLVQMLPAAELSPSRLAVTIWRTLHNLPGSSPVSSGWEGNGLARIAGAIAGLLPGYGHGAAPSFLRVAS